MVFPCHCGFKEAERKRSALTSTLLELRSTRPTPQDSYEGHSDFLRVQPEQDQFHDGYGSGGAVGSRSQGIVNLIDLYPTLAELCGLPEKAGIDGHSFAPLLADVEMKWNQPTLTTMGFGNHSIRDENYRYSHYLDGTEELYDHRNDPLELTNLIERPELASVVTRLRAYLPTHDEETSGEYETDKKRFKRTLAQINKMGPEYRAKAARGELDPDFVKRIYKSVK